MPTVPKPSRGTTQFEEEDEEPQAPAPKVAKKSHSSRQVTGQFTLTVTTSSGQVGETPTGRKGKGKGKGKGPSLLSLSEQLCKNCNITALHLTMNTVDI